MKTFKEIMDDLLENTNEKKDYVNNNIINEKIDQVLMAIKKSHENQEKLFKKYELLEEKLEKIEKKLNNVDCSIKFRTTNHDKIEKMSKNSLPKRLQSIKFDSNSNLTDEIEIIMIEDDDDDMTSGNNITAISKNDLSHDKNKTDSMNKHPHFNQINSKKNNCQTSFMNKRPRIILPDDDQCVSIDFGKDNNNNHHNVATFNKKQSNIDDSDKLNSTFNSLMDEQLLN